MLSMLRAPAVGYLQPEDRLRLLAVTSASDAASLRRTVQFSHSFRVLSCHVAQTTPHFPDVVIFFSERTSASSGALSWLEVVSLLLTRESTMHISSLPGRVLFLCSFLCWWLCGWALMVLQRAFCRLDADRRHSASPCRGEGAQFCWRGPAWSLIAPSPERPFVQHEDQHTAWSAGAMFWAGGCELAGTAHTVYRNDSTSAQTKT